ncbi:hypothetical protein BT63DRAFT_422991 [Microthyrium microscopicum]|uniref:Uncharacterized protein n=1 Tax=Microthyrium microscopicum TaxID=703497 RepID=A0A6A6UM11_9PEZI|nr:hypothetical protein BT63DRAFT_422991 [Microthyrium microscopicum]
MDNIHIKLPDPTRQTTIDPIAARTRWLSTPHVFAVVVLVFISQFEWPRRWLISGAPILTYSLLLGAANGQRFLPFIGLWPFLSTLNLIYAVAATSWLLYWVFVAGCYPLIALSALFQFDRVSNFVRKQLRAVLKDSHFINDKIALFNLPALEIDTEVQGLFVIRGVTVSLSSLTIVAHGVEVAIKLMDDMELSLTTDKVTVSLFRKIEIDDVYANLKGGEFEMTFGDLGDGTVVADEPRLFSDTPSALLRAATMSAESLATPMVEKAEPISYNIPRKTVPPKSTPVKEGLESIEAISSASADATEEYEAALKQIASTSCIAQSREKIIQNLEKSEIDKNFDRENEKHVRAAVCARLHDRASIPHPPQNSISVTAFQNLSNPSVKRFLHRLPMLLRLLLSPLSYFHPIQITSITVGSSGKWIQHLLQGHVFKHYSATSADIRRLETRVNTYLSKAKFILQLNQLASIAHVPFFTSFDIEARLSVADVNISRTLPLETSISQPIQLRGADASVVIPIFLLPHHEHLFPAIPKKEEIGEKKQEVDEADGTLETITAIDELDDLRKDVTKIQISARARLPAVLDQQLLDFIAALVKATKFIEIEKSLENDPADVDVDSDDSEMSTSSRRVAGLKDTMKAFGKTVNTGMEKTWRKGIVGGMANDRWIAKLVGKVTKLLETVKGDVGYSGEIPVSLEAYRLAAEEESKLLG